MKLFPHVPADVMTSRARWYLLIVAGYCWSMSVGLFFVPEWFSSVGFRRVLDLLPFQLLSWGVVHALVGAVAFKASWRGGIDAAYKALIAVSVVVGVWAFGFTWAVICAFQHGTKGSWSAMVAYTSLTLIHLVQARQPIRSPFESALHQLKEK